MKELFGQMKPCKMIQNISIDQIQQQDYYLMLYLKVSFLIRKYTFLRMLDQYNETIFWVIKHYFGRKTSLNRIETLIIMFILSISPKQYTLYLFLRMLKKYEVALGALINLFQLISIIWILYGQKASHQTNYSQINYKTVSELILRSSSCVMIRNQRSKKIINGQKQEKQYYCIQHQYECLEALRKK